MAKQSKSSHSLILGLLFLVLIASLGALAMVFMMQRDQPSEAEVSALCAQRAASSAVTAVQSIARACDNDASTVALKTVAPSATNPGFGYPENWSVVSQDSILSGSLANTITLNNGLVHFCAACDGPLYPISIATQKIDLTTLDSGNPATSFADFANNKYYSDTTFYKNVIKSSEARGTGTLYTFTGYEDGMFSGNFETLLYEGKESWVRVTYFDQDPAETETNDAWETIKASLDFSLIP